MVVAHKSLAYHTAFDRSTLVQHPAKGLLSNQTTASTTPHHYRLLRKKAPRNMASTTGQTRSHNSTRSAQPEVSGGNPCTRNKCGADAVGVDGGGGLTMMLGVQTCVAAGPGSAQRRQLGQKYP